MNKIPSVFLRDPENMNLLTREPHPDALWVLAGEGLVTRKYDGTCMMVDEDGKWWARREVKPGKVAPPNWIPVEKDDITGKVMGWIPMDESGFRGFINEALKPYITFTPGTYELCGGLHTLKWSTTISVEIEIATCMSNIDADYEALCAEFAAITV